MAYPYMISKKPWGTYRNTFDYSVSIFAARDPLSMSACSGASYDPGTSCFSLESFGQKLIVSYPDGRVFFAGTSHSPSYALCIPVINYLVRADGTPLTGRLISYRELDSGPVYYPAFRREAIDRLSRWLAGKSPDIISRAARDLGAAITSGADFAFMLPVLPRLPLTIKLWYPDDELGGSANILFDSSANNYLHTEDLAAAGELAAHFLIRHYSLLAGEK